MTLTELIIFAQDHKIDFNKSVTAVLEMNESLPLTVSTCACSVNKNLVLHTEPKENVQQVANCNTGKQTQQA